MPEHLPFRATRAGPAHVGEIQRLLVVQFPCDGCSSQQGIQPSGRRTGRRPEDLGAMAPVEMIDHPREIEQQALDRREARRDDPPSNPSARCVDDQQRDLCVFGGGETSVEARQCDVSMRAASFDRSAKEHQRGIEQRRQLDHRGQFGNAERGSRLGDAPGREQFNGHDARNLVAGLVAQGGIGEDGTHRAVGSSWSISVRSGDGSTPLDGRRRYPAACSRRRGCRRAAAAPSRGSRDGAAVLLRSRCRSDPAHPGPPRRAQVPSGVRADGRAVQAEHRLRLTHRRAAVLDRHRRAASTDAVEVESVALGDA